MRLVTRVKVTIPRSRLFPHHLHHHFLLPLLHLGFILRLLGGSNSVPTSITTSDRIAPHCRATMITRTDIITGTNRRRRSTRCAHCGRRSCRRIRCGSSGGRSYSSNMSNMSGSRSSRSTRSSSSRSSGTRSNRRCSSIGRSGCVFFAARHTTASRIAPHCRATMIPFADISRSVCVLFVVSHRQIRRKMRGYAGIWLAWCGGGGGRG